MFFSQTTAITISALWFLVRYLLLANILHPAKKCCTVSCSLNNLWWLFSVRPLTFLQALVSIICSIIDLMVDVLLGVKFCSSHILHFLCCFLYISFCISFLLYCSSLFFWLPFLKNFFTCVHVSLNSFSSVFLLISYLLLPILLFYLLLHWKYYFILNWVTQFPSSLEAVI